VSSWEQRRRKEKERDLNESVSRKRRTNPFEDGARHSLQHGKRTDDGYSFFFAFVFNDQQRDMRYTLPVVSPLTSPFPCYCNIDKWEMCYVGERGNRATWAQWGWTMQVERIPVSGMGMAKEGDAKEMLGWIEMNNEYITESDIIIKITEEQNWKFDTYIWFSNLLTINQEEIFRRSARRS